MSSKLDVRFPACNRFLLAVKQTLTIVEADIRKLRHDPSELITRMFQPVIWLFIFGEAMAKAGTVSHVAIPYLDYIAPGILAQSILFIAIFYGIGLIWEKDMGVLHKILVTPTPRVVLVIGRALAAGVRGLVQCVVIYILAYFLGIDLRLDLPALFGVFAIVMLGGAIFSTFSLVVAAIVKKRERFMGIGQVLTMPLFFASNALYPIDIMPTWIRVFSLFNPLTYQVDALRSLMIVGQASQFSLPVDFAVGGLAFCLLVAIATPIYPKILY